MHAFVEPLHTLKASAAISVKSSTEGCDTCRRIWVVGQQTGPISCKPLMGDMHLEIGWWCLCMHAHI